MPNIGESKKLLTGIQEHNQIIKDSVNNYVMKMA